MSICIYWDTTALLFLQPSARSLAAFLDSLLPVAVADLFQRLIQPLLFFRTLLFLLKIKQVHLYRFALCILRDGQEAEDAVSEAVLAGYENIGKLRKEEAFKSWMFTILANQCKKRFRERARLVSLDQEETFFSVEARETDPGLALDVRKAFSILSEEEQMIVGLSVFGGYTSREISRILRMNEHTVRSRKRRALEKMECVLE